jgi:hypothetical protein
MSMRGEGQRDEDMRERDRKQEANPERREGKQRNE